MKISKLYTKILILLLTAGVVSCTSVLASPSSRVLAAAAANPGNVCTINSDGTFTNPNPVSVPGDSNSGGTCILPDQTNSNAICTNRGSVGTCFDSAASSNCSSGSGEADCSKLVTGYINPAIRLLTALMGIVVAGSLIFGGIQYASAGGDPSKVVAARKRLTNSVLALIAYLLMFSLLQWLIPGGIV